MVIRLRSNLTSGCLCLITSLFLWWVIPDQISLVNNNAFIDARFVPKILASVIGLCGLILVVQSYLSGDRHLEFNLTTEFRALRYVVMIIAFAYLLPVIGFIPASLLLGLITLVLSGCRERRYYLIVTALVLFLYAVFSFVLQIRLP